MLPLEQYIYNHRFSSSEFVVQTHRTYEENVIVGNAAGLLETIIEKQQSAGTLMPFLEELQTKIRTIPLIPSVFTKVGGFSTESQKRIPSFTEAVEQTAIRLQFIDQLKEQKLPASLKGIVYGGSLSYGKFYNVRGGVDASDIDMFYIVDPSFFTDVRIAELFPASLGFDETALNSLQQRFQMFTELYHAQRADMLSHKFKTADFQTSIKFMPLRIFQEEFAVRPESLITTQTDYIYGMRDYKQLPYSMPIFTQYNFSHEPYKYRITEEYLPDGTAITTIPGTIIKNSRFYTGDHQNHCIPRYDIVYDTDRSIGTVLQRFHRAIQSRAQFERETISGISDCEVINAQDRKSVLSPRILEESRKKFL